MQASSQHKYSFAEPDSNSRNQTHVTEPDPRAEPDPRERRHMQIQNAPTDLRRRSRHAPYVPERQPLHQRAAIEEQERGHNPRLVPPCQRDWRGGRGSREGKVEHGKMLCVWGGQGRNRTRRCNAASAEDFCNRHLPSRQTAALAARMCCSPCRHSRSLPAARTTKPLPAVHKSDAAASRPHPLCLIQIQASTQPDLEMSLQWSYSSITLWRANTARTRARLACARCICLYGWAAGEG